MVRAFDENILFTVLIELTYRCNLDCFFCYNDLEMRGRPLSRAQYFRFFKDLRDLGVLQVTLSGGEPLAHPDFFALGAHLRELGFVVRIKSNGHALRGAMVERIRAEIDPFNIEISLHGACAETHDRQTRIDGSFARLMGNLRVLREKGMRVQLNSTLTAWNEAEMEAMFALADDLGMPLRFDPSVTPRDDGSLEPLSIAPSPQALARLYEIQRAGAAAAQPASAQPPAKPARPTPKKYCGAGASSLTLDPFGNIYPCVQRRVAAGNQNDRSVKDIWQKSPALDAVRAQSEAAKAIMEPYGVSGKQAGFCPGLAVKLSGGEVRVDAYTRQRVAILGEVLAAEAARTAAVPIVTLTTGDRTR
jgi:MoaA/NifB/PqqE/SkfB family radical SAM enzyme